MVTQWLIYFITRSAQPTHKTSGRNSVHDSTEFHLKIAITSKIWFDLANMTSSAFLMFSDYLFIDGSRTRGHPTSVSWIVCRKAKGFITDTGAKSLTELDVTNKKAPTFALLANVWYVFLFIKKKMFMHAMTQAKNVKRLILSTACRLRFDVGING